MKNAFTYITRACPRNCDYCNIKSGEKPSGKMSVADWIRAFSILKEIGVSFNLILGNETWLLGKKMLDILKENEIPFALYTTAPPKLFEKYRGLYFKSGIIDNLTCGIDYPLTYLAALKRPMTVTEQKSWDGWQALLWAKQHYPHLDMQGNITVYRQNMHLIDILVQELYVKGIFEGVNLIHWDKDGEYDFFPPKDQMQQYLFEEGDLGALHGMFKLVLRNPHLLHHPEVLDIDLDTLKIMVNMEWHCKGDPYGGPTIDSDGSLRCCGYRKGLVTPKLSIFDLPKKLDAWRESVYYDAMQCPGCSWSFPRMFKYWTETDEKFGRDVFTKHAGRLVPEDALPKRRIE